MRILTYTGVVTNKYGGNPLINICVLLNISLCFLTNKDPKLAVPDPEVKKI